jgi:hypothetical protein
MTGHPAGTRAEMSSGLPATGSVVVIESSIHRPWNKTEFDSIRGSAL